MRQSWHITRAWRLALLLAGVSLLAACRTSEHAVRVEYRNLVQRDSVYVDCTDTLFVFVKGDTVRIREKVTEMRHHYSVLHDTISKADTVKVKEVMAAARECPPKRRGLFFFFGVLSTVFLYLCAIIVKKIIKIYTK